MQDTIETIDVDPNELLVDSNIRHSSKLDKDFLASVKELGVVVPIVALRTASGDLRVRFGHRRTAAAIAGELKTVPVLVAGTEGEGDEAQVDRLVKQYAENTHRAELTSAEKIDVVTQLSAFGVKAAEITKKTRIPRAEVKAASTVAKSDVATTVTARYDLTLDQATAVAEFSDDKEAVKTLVATAQQEPEKFTHTLQELRDERTERKVIEPTIEDLRDQGVIVLDERPPRSSSTIPVYRLPGYPYSDPEGNAEKHKECPGHMAFVEATYESEKFDEEQNEWVELDRAEWVWDVEVNYYCTQPELHKNEKSSGRRSTKDGASDAAVAEVDEKAKAERKRILDNNKKWRAAETVRREWLRQLLTAKKPPIGALQFIASDMLSGYGANDGRNLARDLVGIDDESEDTTWTDNQAIMTMLAIVLCTHEARLGVHTWRNRYNGDAALYLKQLSEWKYGLSGIEQSVIDNADGDAA